MKNTKKVSANPLAEQIALILGIRVNQVLGYLDQIKWNRDETLQPLKEHSEGLKYNGRMLPWVFHERQLAAAKNWRAAKKWSANRYQYEEQWTAATADAILTSLELDEIKRTCELAQNGRSNHVIAQAVRKIANLIRTGESNPTLISNQER